MIINLDNLFTFSAYRVTALRNFLSFAVETVKALIQSKELTHTYPNTTILKEFQRLTIEYLEANADAIGEVNLPEVREILEKLSIKINAIKYRALLEQDIPEVNDAIMQLDSLIASPNLVPKSELLKINSEVQSIRISDHLSTITYVKGNYEAIFRIINFLSSPDSDLIDTNLLAMFIDKFSLDNGQIALPAYMTETDMLTVDSVEEEAEHTGDVVVAEPAASTRQTFPIEYVTEDQALLASNRIYSKIFPIADSLAPTEGSAASENIRIFYALYSGVKTLATFPPVLNAYEYLEFQAKLHEFITEIEATLITSECDIGFKESIENILNKIRSVSSHPKLKIEESFSVSKANAQLIVFNKLWLKLSDINTLTPKQRALSYIKEEFHKRVSKIITPTADLEPLLTTIRHIIDNLKVINDAEDHDSFISSRDRVIEELQEHVTACINLGDSKDKILLLLGYIEDFEIWGLNFGAYGEPIADMLETHKDLYSTVIEELHSVVTSLQSTIDSYPLDKNFLKQYYRACIVGCDQSEPAKEMCIVMSESLSGEDSTPNVSVDSSIVMFKSSVSTVEERFFRQRMEEAALRNPAPSIYTHPKFALIHDALEDLDPDSCDIIMEFWNNTIYSNPLYADIAAAFEKILNSEKLQEFIDSFLKGDEFKSDNILTQLMSYESIEGIFKALDIIGKAMENEELEDDVIHKLLDYDSPDAIDAVLHFLPERPNAINYRSPDHHDLTPMLRVVSSRRFNRDNALAMIDILACNGASLSDTDSVGNNPLLLAYKREEPLMFHTLLEHASPAVLEQMNERKESVVSLRGKAVIDSMPLYSSHKSKNMFAILDDEEDNMRIESQVTRRPISV